MGKEETKLTNQLKAYFKGSQDIDYYKVCAGTSEPGEPDVQLTCKRIPYAITVRVEVKVGYSYEEAKNKLLPSQKARIKKHLRVNAPVILLWNTGWYCFNTDKINNELSFQDLYSYIKREYLK